MSVTRMDVHQPTSLFKANTHRIDFNFRSFFPFFLLLLLLTNRVFFVLSFFTFCVLFLSLAGLFFHFFVVSLSV